MEKKCNHCGTSFSLLPLEKRLLKTLQAPEPVECSGCRLQRRMMFRNFFHLYHRTCDLSGRKIISMYRKDVPFPVYGLDEWWSDRWDPASYGQDLAPSNPFLEQVRILHSTVPRMAVNNVQCENCDYSQPSMQSKNCYLVSGNVCNEDCMYGHIVWHSQNCLDCMYVYRCAFCYECVDCVKCHGLRWSRGSDNCSSSAFLIHCTGCKDCFGCVGLKNKQYYIFNQPHSREEYEQKMAQLDTGSSAVIESIAPQVQALIGKEIVKHYHGLNCENVTGDYLYNSRNIEEGYDLKGCEDCCHCATIESFTDTLDINYSGSPTSGELCFNSLTVPGGNHVWFSHNCFSACANIAYCDNCFSCKDCFGCVGMKSKQYCILNKQYSKEEYERLLPPIIESMKADGSWGQFFPHDFSPFAYNETIASQYYPLSKEEVLKRGWKWLDEEPPKEISARAVPDNIRDASDVVTQEIFRCEATGKPYKILPQELAFYHQMKIPLPRKCFEARNKERFTLRNPRNLWDRQCQKCQKPIKTTYAPGRPETVYCEKCYLEAVY